ncbi:MAG: cytochrome oxidase small assembly protein [Burkholderiaceae bacterium]
MTDLQRQQQAGAKRTGWILASVAFAFFIGVIVKFWLLK